MKLKIKEEYSGLHLFKAQREALYSGNAYLDIFLLIEIQDAVKYSIYNFTVKEIVPTGDTRVFRALGKLSKLPRKIEENLYSEGCKHYKEKIDPTCLLNEKVVGGLQNCVHQTLYGLKSVYLPQSEYHWSYPSKKIRKCLNSWLCARGEEFEAFCLSEIGRSRHELTQKELAELWLAMANPDDPGYNVIKAEINQQQTYQARADDICLKYEKQIAWEKEMQDRLKRLEKHYLHNVFVDPYSIVKAKEQIKPFAKHYARNHFIESIPRYEWEKCYSVNKSDLQPSTVASWQQEIDALHLSHKTKERGHDNLIIGWNEICSLLIEAKEV